MITPSFGLTATERVLPRLALDFTTASLDSRITFTRSLGTATRINSSGLVEVVAADTPRFDFTLNTGGACKGLLIEESRTNQLPNSEDFSTWNPGSGVSVATNVDTAPDGNATADRITFTGINQFIYVGVLGMTGNAVSCSCFVKGTAGQTINFKCGGPEELFTFDGTWQRIERSTASATQNQMNFNTAGGATARVFLVWGAQIEINAFATSYIPTEATAVTRNADVATMTGTNFSDWFNPTEGALEINATAISSSQYVSAGSIYLDSNNYITFGFGDLNKPRLLVRNAGTFEVNTTASVAQTSPFNQCVAYKAGSISFASNTTLIVDSVNKAIPSGLDTLRIGANPAIANAYANAWITKINYWPQRLTNNEVTAFSK